MRPTRCRCCRDWSRRVKMTDATVPRLSCRPCHSKPSLCLWLSPFSSTNAISELGDEFFFVSLTKPKSYNSCTFKIKRARIESSNKKNCFFLSSFVFWEIWICNLFNYDRDTVIIVIMSLTWSHMISHETCDIMWYRVKKNYQKKIIFFCFISWNYL